MSWAGSPNTITHHPDIRCGILLTSTDTEWDPQETRQEVFIAGENVDAVLQLETKLEEGLSIRKIEVECIAREDARTSQDALGRILWSFKVPFQGPGVPPSNAVYAEHSPGLPNGYYPARQGRTSFPITIQLPASLPGSLSSPIASISYTLHAYLELAQGADRNILHRSRAIEVLCWASSIDRSPLRYKANHVELKVPHDQGGGMVRVEMTSGGLGGWAVEGEQAFVNVKVVNTSPQEYRILLLRLVKTVSITFRSGKDPTKVVSIEAERAIENHEVAGHCERSCALAVDLPAGQRSAPSQSVSAISVSYALQVSVVQDSNVPRKVEVSLPIEIVNVSSLPSDLWLAHESHLNELRHKLAQARAISQKAQRRWSTPVQLLAGYMTGARPLPTPATPIPGLPRRLSSQLPLSPVTSPSPRPPPPCSPLSYTQPEWIVHQLPPLVEESETKAERTSRHLRETSGNRGRSVSPPPAPAPTSPPRLRRPPSVIGPRPAPARSVSFSQPTQGVPTTPPDTKQDHTPPLLSPIPQNLEPNSYFDQQVHSLPPESPLDLGKFSPATVLSLESFAEQFGLQTPEMDKTLPLSPDESRSRAMNVPLSSSPIRERPSIFSVFAEGTRPEATRRESQERKVAVELRHHREASYAAEVFDETHEEADEVRTILAGDLGQPSIATSNSLLKIPLTKSPTGSARGGRGGKVTQVKDIFTANERRPTTSSPIGDKKVRRKSVPPLASVPTLPQNEVPNKRYSVAIAPSASAPIVPKIAPIATTRPVLPRNESVPTPAIVKRYTALPPVGWKGDRSAKQAFENGDVKEENLVRKRGAVGRLKALIDRFERW